MGFFLRMCLTLTALLMAGCASSPKGPLSLQQQLEHPSTITLPLLESETDVLIVKAGLGDGSEGRFVIDTGATLSAVYPDIQRRLGLVQIERAPTRIHGMIASKLQPVSQISGFELGQTRLPPFRIAIIPRADTDKFDQGLLPPSHDGIIGMDILADFHLLIDKPNEVLRLIPIDLGPPTVSPNWDIVELTRNPFLEDGRSLHFFQLRLGNVLTPALLDTGSQFNMMNWNTKRFPRLRAVHKKLRKDWEINGAIDTFRPVSKILSRRARAGQKFWGDNEFLVLDFESLDVLGIDGKPFVIAGLPMFSKETVLIDFENNKLYFALEKERQKSITVN